MFEPFPGPAAVRHNLGGPMQPEVITNIAVGAILALLTTVLG